MNSWRPHPENTCIDGFKFWPMCNLFTLLFPLWYDVNEKVFLRPLSISDLEYLHRELEEQSEEFYEMEHEPLMNQQSYLFHLAVKIYNSENDLDIIESQIKNYLQFMQMEIQSELDHQIRQVLCRFYSDTDWKILQSELESLVDGYPLLEGTVLGARLNDVLSVKSDSETSEPSKFSDTEYLSQRSDNIQVLFKTLSLERHYKEKLTLQDALVIRQEIEENEQCTKLEQLPMFILQKVMMHDYQSGILPFQRQPNSKSPNQRKPDDSCSSDDDSVTDSDSDTDSDDDDASDAQPLNVHPMDVLLALLHCSDNFLRQDLLTRMSTCQLAIPLLLPDPFTNELTLSLWAMRSIVKEWKCIDSNSGKAISNECHIVNQPTPIVSFYRFGKSQSSKSKVLNFVISNNLHYPFSNFDSRSTKRLLMDGLVELCWFLPAGKPNDPFPKVITFANLRGDARQHSKQTEFLSRVSFMNFVLLTADDLDEKGLEILHELAKAPGGLVLIFSKKPIKDGLELLHKTITKKQYSKVKLSNQGVDDITTAIRGKIKQKLSACEGSHLRNLTHYTKVAHDVGINVDEDHPDCVQGRELADSIQQALTKSSSRSKSMNKIFPLQSGKLWHDWARQDKEKHRHLSIGAIGVEQFNAQKQDEKQRIRLQQLSVLECSESVIHSFILSLLKYTGNIRKYFLQWLKFFLDNISQETLQDQYQAQRHKYKTSTEGLDNHKYSLGVASSIGLEHFLRELGQVYEAVVEQKEKVSPELSDKISRLPQAAAELLLLGYPLELMDGCAACVPLKWVCAVLGKLRARLWDAHLFVLSVLGLQGSGKSTLLNTMFGLQFKVSVGRCTRGAFIQLLPFSDTLKKRVNCDYLLVVDTEGLHSPENTSLETQKHDNELATFVTGLADVTIVNIMSETPGEMENILQTAVHAFIRMKNVQLNPSCQFVYQNVGTMMAQVKGIAGRGIFREKLDKMTKAAAKEEQSGGMYAVFNDVIKFDDEKDVWYFPNLWDGNPPMARVNPGYSESALKLKSRLINLAETKGNQCSFSTFEARIQDLWHAVLNENFVFSFKNTLEIIAYKRLDAAYAKWSWTFQLRMIKWEQEAENVIGNTTDSQELEDLQKNLIYELPSKVSDIHTQLHKEMNKFIKEHEQRDILVQWQCRTELRLNDLRREQETLAITQCNMLVSNQNALAKAVAIKTKHLEELLLKVLQLVPNNKERQVSDSELEEMFDQKWAERITEFKSITVFESDPGIETSVQKCLRELLGADEYMLNPKLTSKSLRERALEQQVALEFKVIEGTHITTKAWSLRKPLTLNVNAQNLKAAQEATDTFLATARQYLESKRMCYYHPCFCHEMLDNLLQAITAKEEIPFTSEYKVDMALTLCGYALTEFEKMADDFRKKNNPIERLEQEMKTPLFLLFKSQYHQIAKEKMAAAILCNLLTKPIRYAVVRSLSHKLVDRMKQDHNYFCSKRSLKGKILCDLAEKGSFDDYVIYLNNVKDSIQVWLKHYTEEYCEQKEGGRRKLVVLADEELKLLVTQISEKAEQVTKSLTTALVARTDAEQGNHDATSDIQLWLHDFHDKLRKDLTVDLHGIQKVVGATIELKDFNYKFFTEELRAGLRMLQVDEAISMESSYRKPYNILSEALIGCCEECPFCKEQCESTDPRHHGKHFIELHRPACLGGMKGFHHELKLDVCNSLVGSTKYFKNPHYYPPDSDEYIYWVDLSFSRAHGPGSNWKFQAYSDYQDIYQDWEIPRDCSKEVSSYWKWFVATYTRQIVAHFGAKPTQVPNDWKTLTKQTVVESVNECYNLDGHEEGFQLVSVTSF